MEGKYFENFGGIVTKSNGTEEIDIKARIEALHPKRQKIEGRNGSDRIGWNKEKWGKDSNSPKRKIDGTRKNGNKTSEDDTEQKEMQMQMQIPKETKKIPEEVIKIPEKVVEAPKQAIETTQETFRKKEVMELLNNLQKLESKRIELRDAQSAFRNDPEKLSQKVEEYEQNNEKIKEADLLVGGKFLTLREGLDILKKEQVSLSETIRKEPYKSENWEKAKKALNRNIKDQEETTKLIEEIENIAGVDKYMLLTLRVTLGGLKKEQEDLSETIRKENLGSENWKKAKENLNRNIKDQEAIAGLLEKIQKKDEMGKFANADTDNQKSR